MDSDASDIVSAICLSGETYEGNDILVCDGDPSTTVGYHQQCCVPPVACIPDSSRFCSECSSQRRDVASELAYPNYAPSSHPTISACSTCSTSSSAFESHSNSNCDSRNDTSSSDSDSSDMSSLTSTSQSSVAAGGQGGAMHLLIFFVAMGCSRHSLDINTTTAAPPPPNGSSTLFATIYDLFQGPVTGAKEVGGVRKRGSNDPPPRASQFSPTQGDTIPP